MLKLFFSLFFLFGINIYAVTIDLNYASSEKIVKNKLFDDDTLNSIKGNITDYDNIEYIIQKYSSKDKKKKKRLSKAHLMENFAILKSLVGYSLNRRFNQRELINAISDAVLEDYQDFSIPLSFGYKVISKDEQKGYTKLKYRLFNYIKKHYAISKTNAYTIKENGKFIQYIDQSKYGVIKVLSNNIVKREYQNDGRVVVSGIVSFAFYPFYKLNRRLFNKEQKTTSSNNIDIQYVDLDKDRSLDIFDKKSKEKILKLYDASKYKEAIVLFQENRSALQSRQGYYNRLRSELFSIDKDMHSFRELKDYIDKSFMKYNEKKASETKIFRCDINSELDFDTAYMVCANRFIKYLKNFSIATINENEALINDTIQESKNNQDLKPIYKKLKLFYFIEDSTPKLLFLIDIGFEQSNYCYSLIKKKRKDKYLNAIFLEYEFNNKSIAIMDHEVTKKEFDKFLSKASSKLKSAIFPNKRCKQYYKKLQSNMPVSCITTYGIKKYIKWLNKTTGEKYRLPKCKQWQYIASCNGKNRFPWGNNDKVKNENIFNFGVKPVQSYKYNGAYLYDMGGNVSEYCKKQITKKRFRVRVVGGNYKEKVPIDKVLKFKSGELYGFRLIKIN